MRAMGGVLACATVGQSAARDIAGGLARGLAADGGEARGEGGGGAESGHGRRRARDDVCQPSK